MSKLEKLYSLVVLIILLQLGYSFVAQGVAIGGDMIWEIFAVYSLPQVVIMLPAFFLLIRMTYRYFKGTFQLQSWSITQMIVYTLASLYIVLAIPQIVIGVFLFLVM